MTAGDKKPRRSGAGMGVVATGLPRFAPLANTLIRFGDMAASHSPRQHALLREILVLHAAEGFGISIPPRPAAFDGEPHSFFVLEDRLLRLNIVFVRKLHRRVSPTSTGGRPIFGDGLCTSCQHQSHGQHKHEFTHASSFFPALYRKTPEGQTPRSPA